MSAILIAACGTDDAQMEGSGAFADNELAAERIAALDTTRYGVNAHLAGDDMLDTLSAIGLRWYRVDAEWSFIERQQGVYSWEDNDRVVAKARALGLSLFASIAYTPSWASGSTNTAAPPRDPTKFVDFVRTFVRRYRGQYACLGIWNEPNLKQFWAGDKNTFINKIFLPAVQAIREEAPEQAICGPETTGTNGRKEWMDPILNVAGQYIDIITHHQYDGGDKPNGRIKEIDDLHNYLQGKGYGNRPIWVTETGWMAPGTSRSTQANYLKDMMHGMQARSWWAKTFWYDSHGEGWGLLGGDAASNRGQPYPAYYTYRDVIAADLAGGAQPDAARLVSHTLPTTLTVGQTVTATVTMANIGTKSWTAAEAYKLGAVGDSDPMGPGRVDLPGDVTVAASAVTPGTYVFSFSLTAPATPGLVTTDWQMVKEFVHWFGPIVSQVVVITASDTEPPIVPGDEHTLKVEHGYRGILGREVDPSGLAAYVGLLNNGGTELEFCRILTTSPEFAGNRASLAAEQLATDLYLGILDRAPDPDGFTSTVADILAGRLAERAAGMLESPEFAASFLE